MAYCKDAKARIHHVLALVGTGTPVLRPCQQDLTISVRPGRNAHPSFSIVPTPLQHHCAPQQCFHRWLLDKSGYSRRSLGVFVLLVLISQGSDALSFSSVPWASTILARVGEVPIVCHVLPRTIHSPSHYTTRDRCA